MSLLDFDTCSACVTLSAIKDTFSTRFEYLLYSLTKTKKAILFYKNDYSANSGDP